MLFAQNNNKYTVSNNKPKLSNYSLNIGSQVGTTFNNDYYFRNYISPSANIKLSNRLSLNIGIGTSFTQTNNSINNNEINYFNGNYSSIYTYISGTYRLTPKVNINASYLYENVMLKDSKNMTINKQYKDISLGLDYSVNKHFYINAQMQFSDRPNFYNPYNNNMFNNYPFY
jgi:hypothetical protein